MQDFGEAFRLAFGLVLSADWDLMEITGLSLRVSLVAVTIFFIAGVPVGATVAIGRVRGRGLAIVLLNALMGLPPVVVGCLSTSCSPTRAHWAGCDLLYTPTAMIVAQTILITPVVAVLSREIVERLHAEYADHFGSLCVPPRPAVAALLWDARYSLLTDALAGLGRAVAKVGAVIIVGPPADPAGVGGMKDAVGAMRKIAAAKAVFASRGDNSGTHQKESAAFAAGARSGATPLCRRDSGPTWWRHPRRGGAPHARTYRAGREQRCASALNLPGREGNWP